MDLALASRTSASSAAADARWTRATHARGETGILVLQESGPGVEQVFVALSDWPRLVREPSPICSLTLVLRRDPEPGETSIADLIERGVLALDVTIAPPQEAMDSHAAAVGATVSSLVPVRTTYSVVDTHDGTTLATSDVEGSALRTGLLVQLDGAQARRALDSLQGNDRTLELSCEVRYRTRPRSVAPIQIQCDLARVWDHLRAEFTAQDPISEDALRAAYLSLWTLGDVNVAFEDGSPIDEGAVGSAFNSFVRAASPILTREASDQGQTSYRLGQRPEYDAVVSASQRRTEVYEISAVALQPVPLADVLAGVSDEAAVDSLVHLVAPGGDGIPRGIPRRCVVSARSRSTSEPMDMVATGPRAMALALAARPSSMGRLSAHSHLAAAAALPIGSSRIPGKPPRPGRWQLDNLRLDVLNPLHQRVQHLPIVSDPEAPLWADRAAPTEFFYAPEFELVRPEPTTGLDASPFQFRCRAAGHDLTGATGLEAEVRLTLRQRMSAATAAAWESGGKKKATPVPTDGLSAELHVPYRDERGTDQMASFPASTIAVNGEIVTVTVPMADNWARVTYGALAIENYQSRSASVSVAYRFEAYVPVRRGETRTAMGGKSLRATYSTAERGGQQDATAGVETNLGLIRFEREPLQRGRPIAGSVIRPPINALAFHPSIHATPLVAEVAAAVRYGVKSQGRTYSMDAFYPCSTLGRFYIDSSSGADVEIGCRPAFSLGVADNRLFEEIATLSAEATKDLRVYRSLRTPGQFVLVPRAYRIGRFGADVSERAYQPDVYLYSTFDANSAAKATCTVLATLVADVPADRRLRLLAETSLLHPSPQLLEPTQLEAEVGFEFAVPSGSGAPLRMTANAVRLEDCIQVSLATDLMGVLPLQAMLTESSIRGHATFKLQDGTTFSSSLEVSLRGIVGPSVGGPIEIAREGGSVQLTNRIEQRIAVVDLVGRDASGAVASLRVDRQVEPAGSTQVEVDPAWTDLVAAVEVDRTVAALPEIRCFVEDIRTTISFVNQIRFENHALAALAVSLRLKGHGDERRLDLPADQPLVQADLILPLTEFAAQPTVELRFHRTSADGAATDTDWKPWELQRQGVVVGIDWAFVQ
jgi:hypothetical protein